MNSLKHFWSVWEKGILPANDDGNINWTEELVASGYQYQEEENMQDATIEYVYGDINGQVDDIIIKNGQCDNMSS